MNYNDSKNDIKFDFVNFVKFMNQHNVLTMAIAAVLSDRINDVTNTFVNSIVLPIIYRDSNNDGIDDVKEIENKIVNIKGIKLGVGKMILSTIRFVIVTYILFLLCNGRCGQTKIVVTN
jgi:large-conductance mechanosensitive channel